MRILDRYVLREVTPSFLLGIGVFTFVLMLNEILRFAQSLVTQSATFGETLGIFLNLLPSVLCLTIPMGFLLGVLIALGRLAADSEIVAMRASGVSLYRLLVPITLAAASAWLLTSHLIIAVLPDSNQRVRQLIFQVMTSQAGTEIRPRVFYDRLFPNYMFLALDTPTSSDAWENVIVADLSRPETPRVTFAERGRLLVDSVKRTVTFYLEDSEVHQVSQNQPDDYQRQVSREIWLPLPTQTFFPPEDIDVPRGARELGLAELRASYAETKLPIYLTEIHKKFSIPFACFVFGVMGLALGIRNRRDGRSWGFVVSLAIIFFYYVLIDIGESMARHGRLSPLLGMWTANFVMGLGAVFLLVRAARETGGSHGRLAAAASLVRRLARRRPRSERPPSPPVVVVRIPRIDIRFPNTLDRYVAREFARYFALILAALVVVYVLGLLIDVIADAFENNVMGKLVFQYLFFAQPQILFHMLPLATLMATLVCFAILTKTSELTAAKAGGVSLYRLAIPVVLSGALVSGACFAIQEYVLPFANRRVSEILDEIKRRPVGSHNVLDRRWMMGRAQHIYNYAYYDASRQIFNGLAIYRFANEPFGIRERYYAHQAIWESEAGGWSLQRGWRRDFTAGGRIERFDELLVRNMEPPSYFVKEEKRSDQMTYVELTRYIEDLKRAGFDVVPLEVARQAKFSFPLAAMVTVLIGIPFSFTPGKKGALYGIGIAITIGLSYYVTTRVFAFMGDTAMLPSTIAAWSPNLLFGVAALYGLFNVRT
ncbi:MAG TPA: LptF/LptG family permease [Vicinamibacteria bacterium]|nr:LptF/LptG family permease [Vicinamibacteria bacterium]